MATREGTRVAAWSSPSGDPVAQPVALTATSAPTGSRLAAALPTGGGPVPLRPLAAGEMLDGAVALVRACPRPVLAVSVVLAIASAVVELAVTLTLLPSVRSVDTNDPSQGLGSLVSLSSISGLTGLLVAAVTTAVLTGVLVTVAGKVLLGQTTTTAELRSAVLPRVLPLLAVGALVGLASAGLVGGTLLLAVGLTATIGGGGAALGFLLLVAASLAAVLLYTRWSLAPAVLVLERASIATSLRRSWRLTGRAFWRTLGVLLLTLLVGSLVGVIVQVPFELLTGHGGLSDLGDANAVSTYDAVVSALAGALATTVVGPFTAGVRALLYLDRRMRAEGLDLTLTGAVPRSSLT